MAASVFCDMIRMASPIFPKGEKLKDADIKAVKMAAFEDEGTNDIDSIELNLRVSFLLE